MKMLRSILIATMILVSGYLNAQVSFTVSNPSGTLCSPATVSFTNTSTIGVNYYWYVGGNYYSELNPTHVFTNPGGYYVELYAYDENWSYVGYYYEYYIVEGASKSYYLSADTACAGDVVYINYYGSNQGVSWDFGDGNTSSFEYAQNTYSTNGKYYINLTVNTALCGSQTLLMDSVVIDNSVIPQPIIYGDVLYNEFCPNELFYVYPNQNYSYINWDFGDGTTSNDYQPTHSYAAEGEKIITLTVQNSCGNFGSVETVASITSYKPFPGWSNLQTSANKACPDELISFYAPNGQYSNYSWNFGDGSTFFDPTSSYTYHSFASLGDYEVSVTYNNLCGNDTTLTKMVSITNSQPIPGWVGINSSETSVCPGSQVTLWTDGGYQNYYWDFGDGGVNTDNYYYVSHTFETVGIYDVSVTFQNSCGSDTTLVRQINVNSNQYIPSWVQAWTYQEAACPGTMIEFGADGGYYNYTWNFDDGNTYTNETYSYAYNTFADIGFYDVSVTFQNGCGNDTTLVIPIEISNNEPISSNVYVNSNQSSICPGENASFNVSSGYSNYTWLFSDGESLSSGTEPYISRTFVDLGEYQVTVTFENGCGNDTSLVASVEVRSNNPIPGWVNLNYSNNYVCPGQEVWFYPPNGFSNYFYDFGDGATLSAQNSNSVNHQFSIPGTYLVSLHFENSCGNDTTINTTINVSSNIPISPWDAYVNASAYDVCPGDVIEFYASYNYQNYLWDFADGSTHSEPSNNQAYHSFDIAGIYNVSVTFENGCGNDTTLEVSINVGSNVPVSSNVYVYASSNLVCPGDQINFQTEYGYKNYVWNFADGNTYSNVESSWATHSFAAVGTYDVSVTFENSCGNDTTLITQIEVTNTAPFDPNMYFYTNTYEACPGDEVRFVTRWGFPQYDFDFGDGATTSSANRVAYHAFDAVGTYNVSVTIYNNCGNDTTLSLQVEIKDNTPIQGWIGMDFSQYEACPNENVYFYSSSLYDNHVWDFGDGGQSNSKYASHAYANSGTYVVSLKVTNACGVDTVIYNTLNITNNLPFAGYIDLNVNPTSICPGDAVGFRTFTNANEHLWAFDDGIFSTLDEVTHTYTTAGTYNVTYTATNGCGNDTSTTFDIIVDANLTPNPDDYEFGIPIANVCLGDSVVYYVVKTSNATYSWDFGDGFTTSSYVDMGEFIVLSHAYDALGTYNVTFTLTNSCGNSFTDVTEVYVTDDAPAVGNVWTDEGGAGVGFCPGSTVPFMLIGGGTYVVDYQDGTAPESYEGTFLTVEHTFADPGLYNVTAYIYNSCGNVDTADTEIIVLGNCSQLYASADGIYPGCSDNDGSATVTPSGGTTPYSYLWDNGQTTETVYGLSDEEHFVTVSDNGGQVFVASAFLVTVSQIDITVATTDANCGISNGSATVSVSGGATPYTYNWSNGATSTTVTGLSSGVTVVGVADANGCVQYAPAAISDIGGATVNATVTDVSCFGSADGSIDVTAIGGAAPLFFNWSNGGILPDQNNLTAGSYELVVRDANNCKTVKAYFIDRPEQIEISSVVTHASCGASDGAVSIAVSGGTSPYSYIWGGGEITSSVSGLTAGIARVTVTDDNGCVKISNNVVNNLTAPVITIDQIVAGACSESNSAIFISVSGGTTPYSYEWSNGSTTEDIENVTPSEYALTLTDGVGCVASLNETIGANLPDESPICLVTVDSAGYNQIVWDKDALTGITQFNVYKESSVAGLYQQIGTQLFTDASVFTDSVSNPLQQAFRYKITAVDDCGNETELSIHHKTIHLAINLGLGGSINLIWSNYEGFDFGTYYINRYTAVNGWEVIDSIASNLNSFTDFNPPTADLYYVVSVKKGENCVATVGTQKASQTYNSSRSNQATKSDGVNSLNEWYASFAATLYPNPTDGEFTLNIAGVKNEDVRYSIYDMQGRLVLDEKLSKVNGDLNQTVDLSHVESGIYSVRVMKGNEVINKKLIVH